MKKLILTFAFLLISFPAFAGMTYVVVPCTDQDQIDVANQTALTCDPIGGDKTFVTNLSDGKDNYCVVSFPDNTSFAQCMRDNFPCYDVDPRIVPVDLPQAQQQMLGRGMAMENQVTKPQSTLSDIVNGE